MGRVPEQMLSGVPAHVDGRMIGISERPGPGVINPDRMWHYTEGITNYDPIWPRHGIRIIPGPSSLWLDAGGGRLPVPLYPGLRHAGDMEYIGKSGYDYTWFILNARIIEKEFALSGQEQNPDLTGKSVRELLQPGQLRTARTGAGVHRPWRGLRQREIRYASWYRHEQAAQCGATGLCDGGGRGYRPRSRGGQPYSKDGQITAIRAARG